MKVAYLDVVRICVEQFAQIADEKIEKGRHGFSRHLCKFDDFAYYAYILYALFRKTGVEEYARRSAWALTLMGEMSEEALAYHTEHGANEGIRNGNLDEMILRSGRSPIAPMDGMFRPTYYLRAYLGLKEEGYLSQEQQDLCEKAVERSIGAITEYLDWGPQNRGMIKALNLSLAAKAFPKNAKASHWGKLGKLMAEENIEQWSIEDAQIYLPVWLDAYIMYQDYFGSEEALLTPQMRFYYDYIKKLTTPLGVIPDFGDARWMNSTEAYICCMERAATLTGDGQLRYTARLLWEKYCECTGDEAGYAAFDKLKNITFLADAMQYRDEAFAEKPLFFTSAQVPDDLIGKKYRLGGGEGEDVRFLFLNYRDEGNYAFLPRRYIRETIVVSHEKTHHGHGDENAVIQLQAGHSILLHDAGYRETKDAKGALPGHYRADFFHNKMVIRSGAPKPEQSLLPFFAQEPEYNRVCTEKIYFSQFDIFDVARTRIHDEKHKAVQDRTVVYFKQHGFYLVCDTVTAMQDGIFTAAGLYYGQEVSQIQKGIFKSQIKYIASDDDEKAYQNDPAYHLKLVFAPNALCITDTAATRRNYQHETAVFQCFSGHLKKGQTVPTACLLMPQKEGGPEECPRLEFLPIVQEDKGYGVRIAWQGHTWLLTDKLDLDWGNIYPEKRPVSTAASAGIDYGNVYTDAVFSFAELFGNRIQYRLLDATQYSYAGKVLFQTPETDMIQPDMSLKRRASRWNKWYDEQILTKE